MKKHLFPMPAGVAENAGLGDVVDGYSGCLKVTYSELLSCGDKYYTKDWEDKPIPCYILKDAIVEYLDVQYMEYTGEETSYMEMDLTKMIDVVVTIIENGVPTGNVLEFN